MRAAVTTGVHEVELLEIPEPSDPGPGEVVIKPEAIGLCGSDFHLVEGELDIFEGSPYPRVQGHEVAGTIVAVGPEVGAELEVGKRVAMHPVSWCGEAHCYPCGLGRGNACDDFSLIGIHTDGGLQEQLLVPASQVMPIAVDDPVIAALAEPISIGVRAIVRSRVVAGEKVVVLGAGPIGQAIQLLVADLGAAPLVVDRVESRLEVARELGADTLLWESAEQVIADAREWSGGAGPSVVFDATGAADPIAAGIEMVVSAGRVVIVGMSGQEVSIRIGIFTEKELDVLGVTCCDGGEFADAIAFVERQGERLRPLISHEFPLERTAEAIEFAIANPQEVMKVIVRND